MGKSRGVQKLSNKFLLAIIVALNILVSCISNGSNRLISGDSEEVVLVYGNSSTDFNMIFCKGGSNVPAGIENKSSMRVKPFWISETEITYELWNTVYNWAIENGYSFENSGRQGGSEAEVTVGNNQHPVTTINWRDAVVFCNALTEYYNQIMGSEITFVYVDENDKSVPIKSSIDESINRGDTLERNIYINPSSKGFRLPLVKEWECAARFRVDNPWADGNFVSGITSDYTNIDKVINVAVFSNNSSGTTSEVKSLYPNELGCYDMAGNVNEWCYDWVPDSTVILKQIKGGSFTNSPYFLQIGYENGDYASSEYYNTGFRIVRNK